MRFPAPPGPAVAVVALALLWALGPATALDHQPAEDGLGGVPGCSSAFDGGRVVGTVAIDRASIFDPDEPGENRRLFRLANRLHRTTREAVVERQLLFASGSAWNPHLLAESERLLRANRYLYDVSIRPVRCRGELVDVEVRTRDVWTLQGGVSFRRAGGANSTDFEVQDVNFLGTGKDVTLAHRTSVDRDLNLIRYRDPNLFGSRWRGELWYEDRSDGELQVADLERPFYSLETGWALGIRGVRDERVDALYEAGEVTGRFRHSRDFVEVYGGLAGGRPGERDRAVRRFRAGFTYDRSRFAPAGGLDPNLHPNLDPNLNQVPADRTLAYPWIAIERAADGFITERDLDRFQRTEDVNLGRQWGVRLGWSSPAFGADSDRGADRLIVNANGGFGARPTPRQLHLVTGGVQGRLGHGAEALLAGVRLRSSFRNFGDHLFVATLSAQAAHDLDAEDQLLLGGDTGLRGYPLRFQAGDRRLLLTLEQRFYSRREIFHLINVGAAVFVDAGRAWFAGDQPSPEGRPEGRPYLVDAGAGLRLGSSRSFRGGVVHLDLAFPLTGNRGIDRVQWLVSTRETF
jgi:hypothetical protein